MSNIPVGLCQCGCGGKTALVTRADPSRGYKRGQPKRFIHLHQRRSNPIQFEMEDRGFKTPCWVWKRFIAPDTGYGSIRIKGKSHSPHKYYYECINGAVGDGLELDHLCRVRACIRPDHLEPVTPIENKRRGLGAKLTVADVLVIREKRRSGETTVSLALQYGISRTAISQACSGARWADVPGRV